jgi:hypothetical protein
MLYAQWNRFDRIDSYCLSCLPDLRSIFIYGWSRDLLSAICQEQCQLSSALVCPVSARQGFTIHAAVIPARETLLGIDTRAQSIYVSKSVSLRMSMYPGQRVLVEHRSWLATKWQYHHISS